jgi:hypothetical protein
LEKRETRDLDGKNDTIKDALETGRENSITPLTNLSG